VLGKANFQKKKKNLRESKFLKKKSNFQVKASLKKKNNEKWCVEAKSWGTFFF